MPSEPVAAESAAPFPESAQQICGCASPPTVLTNENGPDANAVDFHSEATNATDPGVELAGQISPGAMRFENEIRPIFVDHCYRCHGPHSQEAGIRFDRRESIFVASASGVIPVVPGDPDASSVMARLTAADPHIRMPQDADPLPERQIAVLRQWISDGAEWPADLKHWAFRKPSLAPPPGRHDQAWCRNGIDQFVLAKLDAEGLRPAAEADLATLARRLSLDLTGLPPTPAEVDEFVADTGPDAYEQFVDRLLASPHYGEKWATRWPGSKDQRRRRTKMLLKHQRSRSRKGTQPRGTTCRLWQCSSTQLSRGLSLKLTATTKTNLKPGSVGVVCCWMQCRKAVIYPTCRP